LPILESDLRTHPEDIDIAVDIADEEYDVLLNAMDQSISRKKGRVNVADILQTLWRKGYKIVKQDD